VEKLIDVLSIKESSRNTFRMAFRLYNEIYSRKKEFSVDELNRFFERIHGIALEVYDHKLWNYLKTDDEKFVYSEKPDKESAFPLVAVLITYGNAILKDRFSEIEYPDEPEKATVEFILFFIYSYVRSMKSTGNLTTLLVPELIPPAINPIVGRLVDHEESIPAFDTLNVNLIMDILGLNNSLNQADKLEGLYNEAALNKIWGIKHDDMMVGVIMLDGDKFKEVNDCCGHPVGDEVLKIYRDSILRAIESSINLKTRAFPARWGGEEFCVCVFDSSQDEIIGLSKRIESELKAHEKWEDLKGREYEEQKEKKDKIAFPRTFSQGIALGKKLDFGYFNVPQKIADEQMYNAKDNGRNCIYYNDSKV
jgi:diguanylate cyclase (GGDEF)-like protein